MLVSGGGWGIGDLEGAIRSALAGEDTLVVCITGRNEVAREKLEQRFGDNEQVRILGFTEQMSDWMAAADAMIHATAGLTVLEAHIRGCPVVSYGFSAGHLRANNAAFERFGLAEVARSEHELESVLRHVTRERRSPDSSFASLPSIASRALDRAAAGAAAAGLAPADRAGRRRGQPGRRSLVVMMLAVDPPRDPLQGDRQAARGPHPLRQGQRHAAAAPSPAPSRRPAATASRSRRDARRALIGRCSAAGALGGRGRRTRARRWRRSCRRSARRSGSSCARTGAEGVALTFDDGPHPQGTPAVLETLREAGAPATFFLAGEQVVRRPALAAEIVAAGHRVELHCHRHRNQLRLTPRQLLEDAERARAAIEEATGQAIADYRPPYGIFSAAGLRAIRAARLAAGALVALGEGLDAAGDGRVDRRVARRAGAAAGDILLLHDADYYSARGSWVRTAAALPIILEELGGRGLKSLLAAPLSRRCQSPLVAAGERFVEPARHRAARPVLVEDLLGHSSPSLWGGVT